MSNYSGPRCRHGQVPETCDICTPAEKAELREKKKVHGLAEKIFKRLTTTPDGFEGDSLAITRDWQSYNMYVYDWEKDYAIKLINEVLSEPS